MSAGAHGLHWRGVDLFRLKPVHEARILLLALAAGFPAVLTR